MSTEQQRTLWRKVAEQHYPEYLEMLGMSEADATAFVKKKGMYLDVIKRDGYRNRMIERDRVAVHVDNGKVVGIDSVGY